MIIGLYPDILRVVHKGGNLGWDVDMLDFTSFISSRIAGDPVWSEAFANIGRR